MKLVFAKQSATEAVAELEATKELVSQAYLELDKFQESESLAQTECKKAQIKLESIPKLNSSSSFNPFSWMT